MNYKFIPQAVDPRVEIATFFHDDPVQEWIGAKLRELGIHFDVYPQMTPAKTVRSAYTPHGREAPLMRATGKVRMLVAPEDKERAIAVLILLGRC